MSPEPHPEGDLSQASTGRVPRWNVISIALPALALAVGLMALAANPSGRGDYAGALGGAVLLVFGVAAVCALGAVAAVVALVRGERLLWLTLLGLVGNGAVLVPVLAVLLHD